VLVEEREQARLHVVQLRHRAQLIETSEVRAQRAPEPLHLAARGRVLEPRMDERDT
jgi:hypothetical protein